MYWRSMLCQTTPIVGSEHKVSTSESKLTIFPMHARFHYGQPEHANRCIAIILISLYCIEIEIDWLDYFVSHYAELRCIVSRACVMFYCLHSRHCVRADCVRLY